MIEVMVKDEVAVPAERLWKQIRDFGDVSWMNGVTRCETVGEGVGMARLIYVGDGPPVREELASRDDDARRLSYTIPQGNPLPVKEYHATIAVAEAGAERSRLEWSSRFEAAGVSDEQAEAAVAGMYGVLIGWVKAAVEKA